MKKLAPSAAEELLEVFGRRHEAASTLITTNRPTQNSSVFLGDVPATTAILDRFLAHAEIVQLQGKSDRLHQRRTSEERADVQRCAMDADRVLRTRPDRSPGGP